MVQIAEFLANHWILAGAFMAVLGVLIWDLSRDRGDALTPQQLVRLINQEQAITVDIRPESEFERGHIIDALNLPLREFAGRSKELDRHKERPLVVCCAAGMSSAQVVRTLRKQGMARVFNLKGGINAWRQDGLPLVN